MGVNTVDVCDWVVTCPVLADGGAALLESGALLLKMTLRWIVHFLWLRILRHKTIMYVLQLVRMMSWMEGTTGFVSLQVNSLASGKFQLLC